MVHLQVQEMVQAQLLVQLHQQVAEEVVLQIRLMVLVDQEVLEEVHLGHIEVNQIEE